MVTCPSARALRIAGLLVTVLLSACTCGDGQLRAADAVLASPSIIDFGNVVVGTERLEEVKLTVRGAGHVEISAFRIAGSQAFSVKSAVPAQPLSAGGETLVVIAFVPAALGPVEAVLEIENDSIETSSLRVPLKGTGIERPECDDAVACTDDAFDGSAGTCAFTPDHTRCESNDRCAMPTCDAALGCVSTALTCADENECTTDGCDPASGCAFTPVDDGTPCTGAGACDGVFVCRTGICTCRPPDAVGSAHVYPVAWPKAGGGMLVAVPTADTRVQVYHREALPHGTGWRQPLPTTPETTLTAAREGEPIVLFAPPQSRAPSADEDHLFVLVSEQPLVVSIADDERHQPGSPDRIFFMPSTSGTFRGRTFYGQSNGGDPSERIRVTNLSDAVAAVELFAWQDDAWAAHGSGSAAPGETLELDPSIAMTPYKVVSSADAAVLVGYVGDNATAPAIDRDTGMTVGRTLLGYGTAWHLRALGTLSYEVKHKPDGGTWQSVTQGTLAADAFASGQVSAAPGWFSLELTGGDGWAITGTPSLLQNTEWNGYFLPAQDAPGCFVGTKFFTTGLGRSIAVLPNAGTTVTLTGEESGAVLETYTSTGPWEFFEAFSSTRAKVQFTGGPGALVFVGSLNWGACDETTQRGNCGILEGGYSVPAASGFRCEDAGATLTECRQFANQASCGPTL